MIKAVNGKTWADRDPETGRHHRNGHLIELREVEWRCFLCGHWFDVAVDADLFFCGETCIDSQLKCSAVYKKLGKENEDAP